MWEPLLALIAVAAALCQQPVAAQWNPPWIPSYSVSASTYTVHNGSLWITLTYTNWQGFFNNIWTLPNGDNPCQPLSLQHGQCSEGLLHCSPNLRAHSNLMGADMDRRRCCRHVQQLQLDPVGGHYCEHPPHHARHY